MKYLIILGDGMSDEPLVDFGGKTPFEMAKTPNLDWFAKNGVMGYMYPIDEKTVPGSDNSLIGLSSKSFATRTDII